MKKHIANLISLSRVICAAFLLPLNELNSTFLAVYIYCGISDLIDGPIARKTGSTSVAGAVLDTVGDVFTYFALAKVLIMQKMIPDWVLPWICITFVGFGLSAVIAKIRFKKFYFVHSFFGKLLGLSIFLLPLLIKPVGIVYFGIVCVFATIAAVESVVIQTKSKTLVTDVKLLKKNNK